MAAYSYKALDKHGKIQKGIIDGESERHVRNQLRNKYLKPIKVSISSSNSEEVRSSIFSWSKFSQEDLALFSRQLSTLIISGVPLAEALSATALQASKNSVKTKILQIRNHVISGHGLAFSLQQFPESFNDMYCAMVRAGEEAGYLGEILEQLAEYIENRQFTQQKLKMAMIYPMVLLLVTISVISVLMIFVMPQLVNLFSHTETELPAMTRILISLSEFLGAYWWLLVLIFIVMALLCQQLLKSHAVRFRWHGIVLKLPWIGILQKKIDAERFSATLSILLGSGVPLYNALNISAEVMSNLHMQKACLQVAESVHQGENLNSAMAESGLFPPLLVQMVASGESSGNLELMMSRASRNQSRELEMTLAGLLGVMEPLIIVIMATVVGAIVIAVLLPVIQMNDLVV